MAITAVNGVARSRSEDLTRVRAIASVLEVEPDLATGIAPAELPRAILAARACLIPLPKGPWEPPATSRPGLGLLVVSGLLARISRLGRRESLELLAPGDLLRPGEGEAAALVTCDVRWTALEHTAVAQLDERFCRMIGPWPQLSAAIGARAVRRAEWLTVQAAINAHPTVEERLMLMFSHLGERMGRVCPDGIALDLPLSHRQLSSVVQALRPSVTSGLLRLRDDGRLVQRGRGQWLIPPAGQEYVAALCGRDLAEC